ncbi:MAG: AAA family ATPase [Saprospiraceae bacterium]|nr:AAA family ATPase [Saprospiraceae bacterium]
MRIFLLGFMGVGKSTLGMAVAERLHLPFVDLDEWIEDKTEKSITEIFQDYGEPLFRKLESENLAEIIRNYDQFIMGTGGGLPCHGTNLDLMKRSGLTIYLQAGSNELFERLLKSSDKRPMIAGKSPEDQKKLIKSLLNARDPIYAQAHEILNLDLTRTHSENTRRLEAMIKARLDPVVQK